MSNNFNTEQFLTESEEKLYTFSDLQAAYLIGFNNSGEGYNGEYPFSAMENCRPIDDESWLKNRDTLLIAYLKKGN